MSVEADPVPPVPRHTAPVDEKSIQKLFTVNWQQWFEQVREKINVINESLINLISVTGTGIVVKNGAAWAVRTIKGTAAQVDVTNGDGASGDPTVSLAVEVLNSLSLADSSIQPGDNITELTNNAGYIVDAPSDGVLRGRLNGAWAAVPAPGTGTVTSVGMSVPTGLSVAGSPITTSGTLAVSYASGYQGYTSAEASKLAGIAPGAQPGTVTSVGLTGSTGLTIGGSPITTSGTLTAVLSSNLQSWSGIAPSSKANVASPTFTGDPKAPTPATGDNDTSIATTAFVKNQGYTTNSGTVTSVGMSVPTGLSVSGSPVTSSGTLAVTYDAGYQGFTSAESFKLAGIESGAQVNVGTNLGVAPASSNVVITSSTGGGAILPSAATLAAGVMSAADKQKLDGIASGATAYSDTDARAAVISSSIVDGDTTHSPSGDAVFDALALKSNDADVVHNTGNETVAGEKTFTNNIILAAGSSTGTIALSSDAGQIAEISFQSSLVPRWSIRGTNAPESGGNVGTNLRLQAKADDGSNLHNVFEVERSTGVLNFPGPAPTIGGNTIWHEGNLPAGSGTYTPTCTAILNVTSCTANVCTWIRVDGGFALSGSVVINPTAANSSTALDISLPIVTNFTSNLDCSGPVSGKAAGIPNYEVGQIFASSGTSLLRISLYPATTNTYTMRFSVVVPIM